MPFSDQGRKTQAVCLQCGGVFTIYASRIGKSVYCSRICHGASKRVPRHDVPCASCGKLLALTDKQIGRSAKYCSPACVASGNIGRFVTKVRRECERCGNPFEANPARVTNGGAKYCSYKCSNSREARNKPAREGIVLDRSRPGVVYQVTNLVNGKRYIGATSATVAVRGSQHVRAALAGGQRIIERAIRKYGPEMFRFTVLKRCLDMVEAFSEERRLISLLTPEYNMTDGGEGAIGVRRRPGYVHPQQGKPGYWAGKKRSAETVEKMRAALTGKKLNLSLEARETRRQQAALARTAPRRPWSDERRAAHSALMAKVQAKPVVCVDDGLEFPSMRVAAEHYGLRTGSISSVVRGASRTVRGLRFKYAGGE